MNAERLKTALQALVVGSWSDGNAVDVLRNGDEIFPAMLDAISSAQSHIDMVTYIYWKGDIARKLASALAERAQSGVRVRVILDAVGCLPMNPSLVESMREAGCTVEVFRRPEDGFDKLNHRTHRKILVVDGMIGMTGGVGIAKEWEGDARDHTEWRDTHFRITGPAVGNLQAGFMQHWAELGHPVFESLDGLPEAWESAGDVPAFAVTSSTGATYSPIAIAFEALFRLARERVRLASAYFVPREGFVRLLQETSRRGVQVQIMVPGTHADKRVVQLASGPDYEPLFEAGVEIYHYERTMLHTKILTVDGDVSFVGSANFDERSLAHNEELNFVVHDEGVTGTLDAHFEEDLAHSVRIDPERWKDRPAYRKAAEQAIQQVRDLL